MKKLLRQTWQSWDNTGLLIGDGNSTVKKILLTIDITHEVVKEAKQTGCNFIISYHPVIWDGLKNITEDSVVFELVSAELVFIRYIPHLMR